MHTPIEETMAALEDLVRAGKVRYLGVSDTPCVKIAEANVTARFRGWSAFVGLQIEYSLLERTVEQELVPMALELGLGITPWSPLKSGVLSGKYTRKNAGQVKPDRGFIADTFLHDKTMRWWMSCRSSPRRKRVRWHAWRWPGFRRSPA